MFRLFLITLVVLPIFGCGGDSGSGSSTKDSILGKWSYINSTSSCKESYTFNSDGTWSGVSLNEISSGTYTFDSTANSGEKHSLLIIVTSDNGLSDCDGNSTDDTGLTGNLYTLFSNNNTTMEWYLSLTSGTPDHILTKSNAPSKGSTLNIEISSIKEFHFFWDDVSDATFYRLLENVDGNAGFVQIGEVVNSGIGELFYQVPLFEKRNAQYILESCNSTDCIDDAVHFLDSNFEKGVGYFKASNSDSGDYFGWGVALNSDGTVLAVSAIGESSSSKGVDGNQTDNSTTAAGAVYIFEKQNNSWSQSSYIKANNPGATDQFGYAIKLSGDGSTLAVSAFYEDSNSSGLNGAQNDLDVDTGAVYLFKKTAGTWNQVAFIKASNSRQGTRFGYSLDLSDDGKVLVVGAPAEDSRSSGINSIGDYLAGLNYDSGAAYVFREDNNTWSQRAYIKASNAGEVDEFGWDVSISGNGEYLAVGARREKSAATGIGGNQLDDSLYNAGAVYVFSQQNNNWSQQAYIKASNTGYGDTFGSAVSLNEDGSILAIGATSERSSATGINGDESDNSQGGDAGAVYVFNRSNTSWKQEAYIKASTSSGKYFGNSVSLSDSGDQLAVGAYYESGMATGVGGYESFGGARASGSAYTFVKRLGIWEQQAYIKASNTGGPIGTEVIGDQFAWRLALSGDGRSLAVSAPREDSNATGIDNDGNDNTSPNSGAAYIY